MNAAPSFSAGFHLALWRSFSQTAHMYVHVCNVYARTVALLSPVITLVFALCSTKRKKTLEYLENREYAAEERQRDPLPTIG